MRDRDKMKDDAIAHLSDHWKIARICEKTVNMIQILVLGELSNKLWI